MTESEQANNAKKPNIPALAAEECFKPTPTWVRVSLPFAIFVAVILLLSIPYLDHVSSASIVWLLASSYIFLVAGLTLIWNVGIPNGNNEKFKNFDFEVLARDRLKATVAITSMGVLLAVIALIAHTVVIAPKTDKADTSEKKVASDAACCRFVAECANFRAEP